MFKKVQYYIFIGIFSLIFGFAFSLAMHLEQTGQMDISVAQIALICIVSQIILIILYNLNIPVFNKNFTHISSMDCKKYYIIFFVILMISYFVCLLTYFPGVGMNDGLNIMYYGMGTATQFPVCYCAFITILTMIGKILGNLQISVVLYSICQVVIVSGISAWLIMWFWTKPVFKWLKYIVVIYYVAEPLFAMYSISMLKDTVFSLMLTLLMALTYELVNHSFLFKEKSGWVIFTITSLGIIFIRNNGAFIIVPFILVLLAVCAEYRKQILYVGGIVLLGLIINSLPFKIVNKEPLFQEKAGIPLQQISAVVANGGKLTDEQADFIGHIMPLNEIHDRYNPGSVDSIKWNHEFFNRDFLDNHKMEFLHTWFQIMPNNFSIYVKAYLQQTFYFWAPLQKGSVQCFYTIETYADNDWLVSFTDKYGIHDQPLLPGWLNNMLRKYYNLAQYFFREGVLFWIMLASMLLVALKNQNKKILLSYLPGLLLWFTIMLSTPVSSSLRYVFTFVYSLPFYIGFLGCSSEN